VLASGLAMDRWSGSRRLMAGWRALQLFGAALSK
jgi:hypothetical protein